MINTKELIEKKIKLYNKILLEITIQIGEAKTKTEYNILYKIKRNYEDLIRYYSSY